MIYHRDAKLVVGCDWCSRVQELPDQTNLRVMPDGWFEKFSNLARAHACHMHGRRRLIPNAPVDKQQPEMPHVADRHDDDPEDVRATIDPPTRDEL